MNSLVDETITEHEEIEQSNFIEMLLATPVMKWVDRHSLELRSHLATTWKIHYVKIPIFSFLLSLFATLHRRTMGLLRDKDVITSEGNLTDFELLREIWFDFYPRNKNTNRTSSGFEHVFLSEIKKGKIIGWEWSWKGLSWQARGRLFQIELGGDINIIEINYHPPIYSQSFQTPQLVLLSWVWKSWQTWLSRLVWDS